MSVCYFTSVLNAKVISIFLVLVTYPINSSTETAVSNSPSTTTAVKKMEVGCGGRRGFGSDFNPCGEEFGGLYCLLPTESAEKWIPLQSCVWVMFGTISNFQMLKVIISHCKI